MNQFYKNLILWMVIGASILVMTRACSTPETPKIVELNYSTMVSNVRNQTITDAIIKYPLVIGVMLVDDPSSDNDIPQAGDDTSMQARNKVNFKSSIPSEIEKVILYNLMDEAGVNVQIAPEASISSREPEQGFSFTMTILMTVLQAVIFIGLFVLVMRWMQNGKDGGGMGGMGKFGKSKAKRHDISVQKKYTFADVAGVDDAKAELEETVDFLKNPKKYQRLGGRMPKGILMTGDPGTGKTLLAKAMAGESKVPFFSLAGSDFVEMFVGVGASRVRDMFEEARKHSPCIIFIDEVDAIGKARAGSKAGGGGSDEREQTLNQLLVGMDGIIEDDQPIIMIAATNRPDTLDPALTRPGRFDRKVVVSKADVVGREAILKVHVKGIPLDPDVSLQIIARGTSGFSGADLASLCNEAALFGTRRDAELVNMEDFENAKDKVIMGAERKILLTYKQKLETAYHELGHVFVGIFEKDSDPIGKVTVIPRGQAMGLTWHMPAHDKYGQNKNELLAQIRVLLGGRAAEELFLGGDGKGTTGCGNDIERATKIARAIVCKFGMSDLGVLALGQSNLAGDHSIEAHSESTKHQIDIAVQAIGDNAEKVNIEILKQYAETINRMAHELVEKETMSGEEIRNDLRAQGIELPEKKGLEHEQIKNSKEGQNTEGSDPIPEPIHEN